MNRSIHFLSTPCTRGARTQRGNRFENSEIKLVPLVKSANKIDESKNPPQEEDLGPRAHGQSKGKKIMQEGAKNLSKYKACLPRKRRNQPKAGPRCRSTAAGRGERGRGHGGGDGNEEDDDDLAVEYAVSSAGCLDLDRSMPERGRG